jgi:ribosomal protein S18 acetylase RimI-like enzyme
VALSLRSPRSADVPAVEALLLASRPIFSDVECRTALDMFQAGLAAPHEEHAYQLLVAEDDGSVAGYACFGSVPLTRGAFDLYCIAVAPERRGRGIGRALLRRAEELAASQGGRLLMAETSGRPAYEGTRAFYERAESWRSCARIRDFYAPGDDKVVYVKYLGERG